MRRRRVIVDDVSAGVGASGGFILAVLMVRFVPVAAIKTHCIGRLILEELIRSLGHLLHLSSEMDL